MNSKVTEKILTEKQKQNRAKAQAKAEARKAARAQAAAEGKPIPSKKQERQEAKNNAELAKVEQRMVAEPPVDTGIGIKQNELAEEQKALSEKSTSNTSTKPNANTPDLASQLGLDGNTITNALNGDQASRDALDGNVDKASKTIFDTDENGYAKPMSKMSFAEGWERIAPIATVLSAVLAALSGGTFFPINFSKLTGLDDRYNSYLSLCEEQNKQTMGAAGKNKAEEIRAGQEQETAKQAATIENTQDKDLLAFKDKLDTNSKITLSKLAHEQQIEIMKLAADQDAEALSRKFTELLNQGFSREELTTLATAFGAQLGITPNQQAAITFGKFAQPINETINTGLNAAKFFSFK